MGARVVRARARRADDVDRRLVDVRLVDVRLVDPAEAEQIAPQLAKLHAAAMDAGMALGAAPNADAAALERSHRSAVADPGRMVVVVEESDEVVAMAHVVPADAANAPHRAEVQRVAVAAGARGTGLGRRLLKAVEQVALEHGLTLLWLTTHADSDACAFYEALGYTKLGVMDGYSLRPDGTLSPAAFYFKELRRSR